MSLSSTLARFVVETRSDEIPSAAIAAARTAVGDCLGCMLAGSATDVGRIVAGTVTRNGSPAAVTIIGTGLKASALDAALANGASGHALDYDDISWSLYGHPSVAILPAALALAEGQGASGQELLEAVAVGVEIAAKMGRWVNPAHYEHGWHATASVGVFGATAAASRLLQSTVEQAATALSIAASLSSGVRQNFGSMTKPFHAGNASRAGLLAAELAQAGMTADRHALDGRFGWFHTATQSEPPDPGAARSVLGNPWEVVDPGITLKRYPSCGATHCAIDAVLELRARSGFTAGDVARIACDVHPLALKVLQHPRPTTGLEAKFSMEFCLAAAVVDGAPRLEHFNERWTQDPRIQELLPKVTVSDDHGLANTPSADAVPARVVVHLNGGQSMEAMVRVPSGDTRNPMTPEDRAEKFAGCASGVLPEDAIAGAWEMIEALETLPNLSPLLRSLAGPEGARTGLG